MRFIVIVLIVLEAMLFFISMLIPIPEYMSIIIGGVLLFCVWKVCYSRRFSRQTKISLASISGIVVCWALYSAYAMPYWNSITLLDVIGKSYPASRDLNELLSREEAEKDVAFALKQLKKVHPFFLSDKKSALSDLQVTLPFDNNDSISVNHLYQALQRTASSFYDAHTKVFPVLLERHSADYSGLGEVEAINGIQREEFVHKFGVFISSETEEWTKRCVLSRLNSYEDLMLFGVFERDSIQIDFISSDAEHITRTFRREDYPSRQATSSYSLSSDHIGKYEFDDACSCGYLKLDNLYYYSLETRIRVAQNLRRFFTELVGGGYRNLVIDLRDNPGGNVSISQELFRYLPVKSYKMGARYHRRGPILIGRRIVKHNRVFKNLCFKGNIYVLTSLSTFSGAMHLADYLQGNHLAKIVGASPGNTPTCYTDIAHFVLPCSSLSMTVSTGLFIRTDDTQEENVIIPDLPCKASSAYQTLMESLLGGNDDGL